MDAPKNTGRFGKGNPGKPKGAVSKTTKAAKEAIALGGVDEVLPLNELPGRVLACLRGAPPKSAEPI